MSFGGDPTYDLFWLSTAILNEYYLIFVLLFDMHVIFYIWVNLVFMIVHYYSLLRYDFTLTLFIFMHDSFYYLIISLISINFFINFHTCFTLFSRPVFMDLGGCYGLYRTFPTSNLTPGPRLGFSQTCFSFRSHT